MAAPSDRHGSGREPRVSVIVPTWNRRPTLARAIASALGQTVAPFEILVVDDGSTDGTAADVAALAAREPRIRYLPGAANRGAAAARNRGLDEAGGEFVAFLDSDDEWTERHLERGLATLGRRPDCALVFAPFYVQDGGRRHLQPCGTLDGDLLEYLFYGHGGLRTSTFVGRRDALRVVGFDEALRKHQDWDFALNLRRRFAIATDTEATAILHVSADDRLSARPDPEASLAFFRKNRAHASRTGWVLYFSILLETTYRAQGRGPAFLRYLSLLDETDPEAGAVIRRLTRLLALPRIGRRLFRVACRRYCRAASALRARPAA
jgi:glycosyltransferase involved in cell wall biosynthesis